MTEPRASSTVGKVTSRQVLNAAWVLFDAYDKVAPAVSGTFFLWRIDAARPQVDDWVKRALGGGGEQSVVRTT